MIFLISISIHYTLNADSSFWQLTVLVCQSLLPLIGSVAVLRFICVCVNLLK